MSRSSACLLALLVVGTAACGSTTGTVDSVDTAPTTSNEPDDNDVASDTVPPTPPVGDTGAPSSTPPQTTSEDHDGTAPVGTAITQISPQAVPALTVDSTRPTAMESGEFPLDPSSARVQATVADLAKRLGVAETDVTLVDARAVTWGDSSLGCPQPGMQYLQRVTDGSLVILSVDGVDYRYTGGDPLRFCDQPTKD